MSVSPESTSLNCPVGTTHFAFDADVGSLTLDMLGVSFPIADPSVARSYAFGAPMTLVRKQEWEIASNVTVRLTGDLSGASSAALSVLSRTPTASVVLSGANADYAGALTTSNACVFVSGTEPLGASTAALVDLSVGSHWAEYVKAENFVLNLQAPGATISRPLQIFTRITGTDMGTRVLCAEANTTNAITKLTIERSPGSMCYQMWLGENSYTRLDTFQAQYPHAMRFFGPGALEIGKYNYAHSNVDKPEKGIVFGGDGMKAKLTDVWTQYARVIVESNAEVTVTSPDVWTLKNRRWDASEIIVRGKLKACDGCALWRLSGTGTVEAVSFVPVALVGGAPSVRKDTSGTVTNGVNCGIVFGAGVSFSVTNGLYAISVSSPSDGVLAVSDKAMLTLEKGAQWPNGTLNIAAGNSVELGRGAHRFDKLVIDGQQLPPGVYCERYANPLTDGYLKGPGRLYVGGCVSGAVFFVR